MRSLTDNMSLRQLNVLCLIAVFHTVTLGFRHRISIADVPIELTDVFNVLLKSEARIYMTAGKPLRRRKLVVVTWSSEVHRNMFDDFNNDLSKNKMGAMEISRAMKLHRDDNCFKAHQFDLICRFKVELEVHLSNYFGTYVSLMIYGSTLNGFGTRTCDVDMSLSFPLGPPKGKVIVAGVVCPDLVIREVAKALVDYPNARDEQYICAKVPIVRFRSKDADIEADISYRNDLALHNTKLLHQYCKWDRDRLPTLGIWVKTVLHSQCIDVSTFELFVGFLDYFSTYFQYKRHIIQINVPWQVRRNRKWRRCPMVISDPFELDHNLAQSVNEDMFQYICLCMEHCHSVFMDQNLRTEFLVSKGCLRGTTDKVHMNDDLLREYGVSPFTDVLVMHAYKYVLITSPS
uniref:PAP-associated domain-containing protein n=1 Tax=Angiostrongylus cantonensis TaxID=6313 RepID=A0A0K0DAN8_ANGCA